MIKRYTRPEMGQIWSEENKFNLWLKVELAVVEAWQKLGKIPAASVKKIKAKARFEVPRIEAIEKEVNHDVIAFLTNLAEHIGVDSRFVHLGMTSSDVVDTALSLQIKEALALILNGAENLQSILKKLSLKYQNTAMIGRTHGVHAEPMTLGLKFALWYEEIGRGILRLKQAEEIISAGKISGAVGTFAHVTPALEKIVCQKLGLKPALVSNQIVQRDRHAQVMTALAIFAGTLEKMATEIRSLQRTEIGELEEPFAKGQKGSSAMPHKKNPIICERICGLSRLVRGYTLTALENICLWNERDISHSSAERVILPDSTIVIDYMIHKMIGILKDLQVFPERMKANLDLTEGVIFSQKLLLALVEAGLTREEAYRIVQTNAHQALKEKKPLKDLLLKASEVKKSLGVKKINEIFDLKQVLKNVKQIFKRVFKNKN